MKLNKSMLLNYGLAKEYFTKIEYAWCMDGGDIKDLLRKIDESKLMLKLKSEIGFEEDYRVYEPFLELRRKVK